MAQRLKSELPEGKDKSSKIFFSDFQSHSIQSRALPLNFFTKYNKMFRNFFKVFLNRKHKKLQIAWGNTYSQTTKKSEIVVRK